MYIPDPEFLPEEKRSDLLSILKVQMEMMREKVELGSDEEEWGQEDEDYWA